MPQSSRTGAPAEKFFFLRLVNPLTYFTRIHIDRVMNELRLCLLILPEHFKLPRVAVVRGYALSSNHEQSGRVA